MSPLELESPPVEPAVYYPSSDGEPMAETDLHISALADVLGTLRFYFRERSDIFVGGDLFVYYERGNPNARRAPDVLVAIGVPKQRRRDSYFTWIEGVFPQVLFEFSSPSTVREDLTTKRELYAKLGANEYFLFDPPGESLQPRFQGFRRTGTTFFPIAPDADGGMTSAVMGVRLVPEGDYLRVWDCATGTRVPNLAEQDDMLRAATARYHGEQQRAETERQRAETERQRAETERQRADTERQRADTERQRAEEQAAEIARLKALLNQQTPPTE